MQQMKKHVLPATQTEDTHYKDDKLHISGYLISDDLDVYYSLYILIS